MAMQGGDPGAVPAGAGQPVPAEHRDGPGHGDQRAGAPGAARRGDLPQDQQQGARAGHAAGPQQPQPALLRAVPPRDPGRVRAAAAGRHRGRAPALHPERRARRGVGHLHARAQGAGGQEGGAGALPVRQQGPRRRALPRRQLQRQVGRRHRRRRILLDCKIDPLDTPCAVVCAHSSCYLEIHRIKIKVAPRKRKGKIVNKAELLGIFIVF
jgi:hypothetical protein